MPRAVLIGLLAGLLAAPLAMGFGSEPVVEAGDGAHAAPDGRDRQEDQQGDAAASASQVPTWQIAVSIPELSDLGPILDHGLGRSERLAMLPAPLTQLLQLAQSLGLSGSDLPYALRGLALQWSAGLAPSAPALHFQAQLYEPQASALWSRIQDQAVAAQMGEPWWQQARADSPMPVPIYALGPWQFARDDQHAVWGRKGRPGAALKLPAAAHRLWLQWRVDSPLVGSLSGSALVADGRGDDGTLPLSGSLIWELSGLQPLGPLAPWSLPRGQLGVLAVGLRGDGSLSPWLRDALAQALTLNHGFQLPKELIAELQGPLLLTRGGGDSGTMPLSLAMAHRPSLRTLLASQVSDQQTVDWEAIMAAAEKAPQALPWPGRQPWWLRHHQGLWWLSADQVLLAQVVLGLPEAPSPLNAYQVDPQAALILALDHHAASVPLASTSAVWDPHAQEGMNERLRPAGEQSAAVSGWGLLGEFAHFGAHSYWSLVPQKGGFQLTAQRPLAPMLALLWYIDGDRERAVEDQRAHRRQLLRTLHDQWRQDRQVAEAAAEGQASPADQRPQGMTVLWPQEAWRPHAVLAVDHPRHYDNRGVYVLFMDGSVVWIDRANVPQVAEIARRAEALARIYATGHAPRQPWGRLQEVIQAAYNHYHTGDPDLSPHQSGGASAPGPARP